MKLLIKIGVQKSCTPISLFVPQTLPVKGYKTPSQKFQWTHWILFHSPNKAFLSWSSVVGFLTPTYPPVQFVPKMFNWRHIWTTGWPVKRLNAMIHQKLSTNSRNMKFGIVLLENEIMLLD